MQTLRGVYSVMVSGSAGCSLGIIAFHNGYLRGNTFDGGRYEGTAKPVRDDSLSLSISLTMPPGVRPVWGAAPSGTFQTGTAELLIPFATIRGAKPHFLPAYELWVIIQKASEDLTHLAGDEGRAEMIRTLQQADAAWRKIREAH
ncbi:hypothetical protein GN330_12045 [Nitratireductor sp. CAU 1489]|uniref:DUF1842 domain-containing protein n=1 Tax=Nitratireductor arenosus TaxID=2682096 RepID=A0A844QDA6_9HYPH|nr:hypothetical protein [Nitratireductor arenosus]MVA97976.1 hypothetical protein [Nitratireductor arenosus]